MIDTLLAHIGVFSEGMRFSEENFKINIIVSVMRLKMN